MLVSAGGVCVHASEIMQPAARELLRGRGKQTSDFRRHIAAETEKWGKVVRAANLRAD